MCSPDNISIKTMDAFVKKCSLYGFDDYEPYINYDLEPDAKDADCCSPLLCKSGMKLFEDKNTLALFLMDYEGGLAGYCSAFTYPDKNASLFYEISVLVAPEYRRHGLGSLLVSRMLFIIDKRGSFTNDNYANNNNNNNNNNNIEETSAENEVHILLSGSNDDFAKRNGFTYSHSEHFMVRRPYFEPDTGENPKASRQTETYAINTGAICTYTSDTDAENLHAMSKTDSSIAITRTPHRTSGHYTYRLFSDGSSASKCTVLECSDYVNIANVYTNKAFRGRRYAGLLINAVATDFPQKKLLLQVSGSNTAAIHAYTGAGFTFLRSFDYYRLEA